MASYAFADYAADQVIVTWNGININGFSDDTFVEVERDEDGFTTVTGALGDVTRARQLNRTGKITITLLAHAPVNAELAALAQEDEDFGGGYGPIQVKDLTNRMLADGAEAWVMKRPKLERAKEGGTVQWVFAVAYLNVYESDAP